MVVSRCAPRGGVEAHGLSLLAELAGIAQRRADAGAEELAVLPGEGDFKPARALIPNFLYRL